MADWHKRDQHIVVVTSMVHVFPIGYPVFELGSEHIISHVGFDANGNPMFWLEGVQFTYGDPAWNGAYSALFFRPVEEIQQFRAMLTPSKQRKYEIFREMMDEKDARHHKATR